MVASFADGVVQSTPWYWWVIGFGGQLVFASRFWVQWIASERAKQSVMPISFWWLSISGGTRKPRERSGVHVMLRTRPVFSYASWKVWSLK